MLFWINSWYNFIKEFSVVLKNTICLKELHKEKEKEGERKEATKREMKGGRKREIKCFTCWSIAQIAKTVRAVPNQKPDFIRIPHMSGKDPLSWTIFYCCFPRQLSASWIESGAAEAGIST